MFLATTALTEFWDPTQELLFLGSWCVRQDRRHDWEALRYQIMPSPWDDRERFAAAVEELDCVSERLLEKLAAYLNDTHAVFYPQRYWRILIGPWLLHFVHVLYDRHLHLVEAFRRDRTLTTVVLDPSSFRVPADTAAFTKWVVDDPYNLQLCSHLLQEMGYAFPAKPFGRPWSDGQPTQRPLRPGGWCLASRCLNRLMFRTRKALLCTMYCETAQLWQLAWRSRFLAIPYGPNGFWKEVPTEAVFDRRRHGLETLNASDSFERLVVRMLPRHFPSLYLEGYQAARETICRTHRTWPPLIVSAIGWYQEGFKFLAAEASARGSRLVTVQHGGGYGLQRLDVREQHESRVADAYWVWGWTSQKRRGTTRKDVPSLHLSSFVNDQRKRAWSRHQTDVIWYVATTHPRYLYRFQSCPVGSQWEEYFAWQRRFFEALSERLRSQILFRPYLRDYGQAMTARLAERFPDLRVDEGQPIAQRIRQAGLLVIDHSGTTLFEAMVANVPTVLFWDSRYWEMREEAKPDVDALRQAEILWDSPEAVAGHVESIAEDPRRWWDSQRVQQARVRFMGRYALADAAWLDRWIEALEHEALLVRNGE